MKREAGADASIGHLPLVPATLDVDVQGGTRDRASRLAKLLDGETASYAVLSVGDLLYDAFRIDPLAVEGIDFARAADLSDILRLAHFSEGLSELSARAQAGNIAQLQGYVAERVAAHALLASGADVSFPATSNQPGWDLLVNGEPFQVKCLATPAGVHEHFARYPDIPVITNGELAQFFVGDGRVTALGFFNHHDVEAVTRQTLDGAADLLDLQIPLITGAIASARAGFAVLNKESDPLTALKAMTIGVVAGAGGAKGGALAAGVALGLLGVAGGWVSIIAPVFGGIIGFKGGGLAGSLLKKNLLCRIETAALRTATQDFSREAARVISAMTASSARFRARVAAMPEGEGVFAGAMKADWLKRVDRELDRRRFYRGRLTSAAEDPRSIELSAHDPRIHAMQVMWAAARGGVLEANVRSATEVLRVAVARYDSALKKWLMK